MHLDNCIKGSQKKQYVNFWENISCQSKFRKYNSSLKKVKCLQCCLFALPLHDTYPLKLKKSTFGNYPSSKFTSVPSSQFPEGSYSAYVLLIHD